MTNNLTKRVIATGRATPYQIQTLYGELHSRPRGTGIEEHPAYHALRATGLSQTDITDHLAKLDPIGTKPHKSKYTPKFGWSSSYRW